MKKQRASTTKRQLTPDEIKFVMNAVRRESVKWSGRNEALRRARKRVRVGKTKKGKTIWKLFWMCAHCQEWFRNEHEVEVDHIIEIGPFCGDWNKTLLRMLPDVDGLAVLCRVCHLRKTNAYNAAHLKWKRKVPR